MLPPAVLYIFGAGHVAYNLYNVATIAGFEVVVVDDRESYANRERFPDAREVIADDFETVTARLGLCEGAYIVIVLSPGHRRRRACACCAGPVESRAPLPGDDQDRSCATISIYKELEKEGIPAEKFTKVHAPVGLEIGAVTPEEIAVAIAAEMIAERRTCCKQRRQQNVFVYRRATRRAHDEQDAAEKEPARNS